jgi:hypothetical protein
MPPLFAKGLGDVVLFDVIDGLPRERPTCRMRTGGRLDGNVIGTNKYDDMPARRLHRDGRYARKPGMSRDDLVGTNAKIISSVAEGSKHAVRLSSWLLTRWTPCNINKAGRASQRSVLSVNRES